jgi:acyl homoserine lactone synthase
MIEMAEGRYFSRCDQPLREMFQMRAEVFSSRLGWDVTVREGMEIDRFDDENPIYLLSMDETSSRLRGAVRLLPTTGPYMLRDVFHSLLPDGAPNSCHIWESSRFAINPSILTGSKPARANHVVSRTTIELLCGIVEVCRKLHVGQLVSVFDARMARILRAVGCDFEPLGPPRRIGNTLTYAGRFEMTKQLRERLGRVGGFPSPVLAPSPLIAPKSNEISVCTGTILQAPTARTSDTTQERGCPCQPGR